MKGLIISAVIFASLATSMFCLVYFTGSMERTVPFRAMELQCNITDSELESARQRLDNIVTDSGFNPLAIGRLGASNSKCSNSVAISYQKSILGLFIVNFFADVKVCSRSDIKCADDLDDCLDNSTAIVTRTDIFSRNLTTCTFNNTIITTNLTTCTSNITQLTTNLSRCNANNTAISSSLIACTNNATNLSLLTNKVDNCTANSTVLSNRFGTCNATLTSQQNNYATCNQNVATLNSSILELNTTKNICKLNLATCRALENNQTVCVPVSLVSSFAIGKEDLFGSGTVRQNVTQTCDHRVVDESCTSGSLVRYDTSLSTATVISGSRYSFCVVQDLSTYSELVVEGPAVTLSSSHEEYVLLPYLAYSTLNHTVSATGQSVVNPSVTFPVSLVIVDRQINIDLQPTRVAAVKFVPYFPIGWSESTYKISLAKVRFSPGAFPTRAPVALPILKMASFAK